MPLLTVTNLTTSAIALQDALGVTPLSFTVQGGATMSNRVVTLMDLAALESELVAATTAGWITWSVVDDPVSVADGGVFTDGIVFRPYSALPSHGNVYVTWAEVMAVISATATLGTRNLYFDFIGSATFAPPSYGSPSWEMPNGTWDMKNVVWKDIPSNVVGFDGGNTLSFADNCHVTNLSKIDGSSLIIMNSSTTNTPIKLNAACAKLHLSGFLMFCNDSIAEYAPNPTAKPVIKFDDPGTFYQIYSDSSQVMLGLYGQGPQTFQDTNTPPPPIVDLGGAFCFLRVQFNTKAITSSIPGAFVVVERVSDEIASGFAIQDWTFVNDANVTLFCANMTRVSYWNDNNQGAPTGLGVISAATFSTTPRSGQYQPYPAISDATHYLAIHNQVVFCDPTPDGPTTLVIELPTALRANGEVIKIVDVTGAAGVLSPITINAKAGEFVINGAAPAASTSITTPYGRVELICNGLGQWIAT